VRVKLFIGSCVSLLVALVIQGCIIDSAKDKETGGTGTDIDGKWLKVRMVSELNVGGTITADTLEYDTSEYAREFLVIHDSTFLEVTYSPLTEGADTTVLEAHAVAAQWEIAAETVTITRVGNVLKIISSAGAGLSTREEFILQAGIFPPSGWMSDTSAGSVGSDQTWMIVRSILKEYYNGSLDSITITRDTSDVFARSFVRIQEDTLFFQDITGRDSHVRLDGTRWVNIHGDTLVLASSGLQITLTLYTHNEEDELFPREQWVLVRYYRDFPPTEWTAGPVDPAEPNNVRSAATPLVVDAAARIAGLGAGDADWYSFMAQAGVNYYIHTTGDLDTYLRLYSSGGDSITENDDEDGTNAGLLWTANSSGTYYFSVRGYEDAEIGSYMIAVEHDTTTIDTTTPVDTLSGDIEPDNNLKVGARAITANTTSYPGALQVGDVDWYSFTAQAGKAYYLYTDGETDTYLRLYSAAGILLDENDDDDYLTLNAGIIFIPDTSGIYYFTVRGYQDAQVGAYALLLEDGEILAKRAQDAAPIKKKKR
jgi:hypothetical protein